MKKIFEMKLVRQLASASVAAIAACALSAGSCYAQQATPAPSPAVSTASDGKETKEAKKVVEQPKPPEPRFKLYGWIEAGIMGNPDPPVDNHNFGHLYNRPFQRTASESDVDRRRTSAGPQCHRIRLGIQRLVHVRERRALHEIAWLHGSGDRLYGFSPIFRSFTSAFTYRFQERTALM